MRVGRKNMGNLCFLRIGICDFRRGYTCVCIIALYMPSVRAQLTKLSFLFVRGGGEFSWMVTTRSKQHTKI